jgi:hypothetical protein
MAKKTDKLMQLKEREAAKVLRVVDNVAFQNRIAVFKAAKASGVEDAELQAQLEIITNDFLPNDRWIRGLKNYIATNDVNNLMPDLLGPRIKFRFNDAGNKVGLDLELDPYTELVDIEAVWDLANNVLLTIKDTPLKTQAYHNLKRDSMIYHLRQTTDMTNFKIAEFATAQGYQGITPEYITTIIRRYKKRHNIITP